MSRFKKENYWLHTVCPSICPYVVSAETAKFTFIILDLAQFNPLALELDI